MQYFKVFNRQGKSKRFISSLLGFAVLCLVGSTAYAQVVVIGNSDIPAQHITKAQAKSLYLGNSSAIGSNKNIQIFDQPESSKAYQQFYKLLLHWSPSQVSSYWSSLTFSGEGTQPYTVDNDAQAIAEVEHTPGGVAYINSSALQGVGNKIKVLLTLGSGKLPDRFAKTKHRHRKLAPGQNIDATNSHVNQNHYNSLNTILAKEITSAESNTTVATPSQNQENKQTAKQSSANLWNIIRAHFTLGNFSNNPRVQRLIRYYTRPGHRWVVKMFIKQSIPYLYYVYQQTKLRHMPAEFALLPMVESGYSPAATSDVGAAGLWQLMPGTASSFGLDINWWYDGRRDVIASTHAALDYLVGLHKALGTWELAAAGYNAGQGTVDAAIDYNRRLHRATDFWVLPLPRQTRRYVPKLLALAAIIKHPKRYGFTLPYVPDKPYFKVITMTSQIDAQEAATLAGVSVKVIKALNSGMRRFASRPSGHYRLLVPASHMQEFLHNLALVAGHTHVSWIYHEVKRGQTLKAIAQEYDTTVALLKRVNHLKNNRIRIREGLLVPVHLHQKYTLALHQATAPTVVKAQPAKTIVKPKTTTVSDQKGGIVLQKLSAADLLSGNHLKIKLKQSLNLLMKTKPVTHASQPVTHETASNNAAASVTLKQQGVPIKKTDSLKTLLGKIYGSNS